MSMLLSLPIDWAEAFDWKCPFCGGEIDHLDQNPDEDRGVVDDSYSCQENGGDLCEHAYFMVRWSLVRDGDNGDALTLARWIDIEIDEQYITDPEKAAEHERPRYIKAKFKALERNLADAMALLETAREKLDEEGVLSTDPADNFTVNLYGLREQVKHPAIRKSERL